MKRRVLDEAIPPCGGLVHQKEKNQINEVVDWGSPVRTPGWGKRNLIEEFVGIGESD